MKLEARLDVPSNSGIQFRSHQRAGDGCVFGYQCEIDPSERAWTAGIYDEARRGWLYPLEGHPEAQHAFKPTDWNLFVIEGRGPHLRTWLNGVPCADLLDTMDLEGFIALQVHAAKEGRIRWRNIRIKDLRQSQWRPLWDGRSLAGWQKQGDGAWSVEEGAIRARLSRDAGHPARLVAAGPQSDFALRLKVKVIEGHGGVLFRAGQGAGGRLVGLEATIEAGGGAGSLIESGGRGLLARARPPAPLPTAKAKAKAKVKAAPKAKPGFKANDWNQVSLVALGDRVAILVNGQKTAEVRDPALRKTGQIALEVSGDQGAELLFKEIEAVKADAP